MTPEPTSEPEFSAPVEPVPAPESPLPEAIRTSFSATASVQTGSLAATGCAIGLATVTGDATLTASAAPLVYSKGNVSLRQCYTSAVVAATQVELSQGGAPLIVAKKLSVQQGGAMVMLSGKSKVKSGFVGVLLSPRAEVSENSRVLVGPRAALIIAAALLGGFGLLAVAMALGMKRMMKGRLRGHSTHFPPLAEIQERLSRMKSCPVCRKR